VQFQLARAATDVEAARLLVYNAARLRDAQQPFLKEAAMCKLFASEVAERTASLAVNLYGGYGFVKDYPVEMSVSRQPIDRQSYEGTSNWQLQTAIAKQIAVVVNSPTAARFDRIRARPTAHVPIELEPELLLQCDGERRQLRIREGVRGPLQQQLKQPRESVLSMTRRRPTRASESGERRERPCRPAANSPYVDAMLHGGTVDARLRRRERHRRGRRCRLEARRSPRSTAWSRGPNLPSSARGESKHRHLAPLRMGDS
jgi:hypothetical protein